MFTGLMTAIPLVNHVLIKKFLTQTPRHILIILNLIMIRPLELPPPMHLDQMSFTTTSV